MARSLSVVIPGEPVAQGRPRFSRYGGKNRPALQHPRAIEPEKSRSWKGEARGAMRSALEFENIIQFPEGPLAVEIVAFFTCPRSDWRKREPTPRRLHAKVPDAENVAKAVLDAGTSVLWTDDSQVARLTVEKFIAAQGEAPRVEMIVRSMGGPEPLQ